MDSIIILIAVGFLIGTFGTLIGAGGGFLLVPLLLLTHPEMQPEIVTAISLSIVSINAISGSVAYARSGRIDYKAGMLFATYTIPGSVLGVFLVTYIPHRAFNFIFGIILAALAIYLFIKNRKSAPIYQGVENTGRGWRTHSVTDSQGGTYTYTYNQHHGIIISILVGFLSPLLGIGGGIIHVPAMVQWLSFPVQVATASSHFILAIMSTISVIVHALNGNYNNPEVLRIVIGLGIGALTGAQLGAYLSHRIKTVIIIRILAICLALVGVRILVSSL
jgi:uncharacterized membrane protein YfcA